MIPNRTIAPVLIGLVALPAAHAAGALGDDFTYLGLMRLSPEQRVERIENAPDDQRRALLSRLSGAHAAVLVVDPADCTGWARTKRMSVAVGEQAPPAGEGVVKEVAGSITRGMLGFLLPSGLGQAVGTAADLNEARKGVGKVLAYRDVCELSPDERAALLAPAEEPPPPPQVDPTALDRVSRFLSR